MTTPATTSGEATGNISDQIMQIIMQKGTVSSSELKSTLSHIKPKSIPPALSGLFHEGYVLRESLNREFIYSPGTVPYKATGISRYPNGRSSYTRKPTSPTTDSVAITLNVQGKRVECTLEEARRIYTQLGRLFGVRGNGD